MAIAGYQYRVNGGSAVDVGNVLTTDVTGLSPATEYDFEIRSYDDATPTPNFSAWSAVVSATTDAAAWSPLSLGAALQGWWAADNITGKVDNDTLPTWTDASGNANHATETVGWQSAPTYKTGGPNGKPFVRFDNAGTNGNGLATPWVPAAPYSLFLVYAWRGSVSASQRVLSGHATNWLIGPWGGNHTMYDGAFRTSPPAAVQNDYVYISVIVGVVNTLFYVDGTLISTQATGAVPSKLEFGFGSGANPEPANSDVLECFATNVDSSADRAAAETYIVTKYAL